MVARPLKNLDRAICPSASEPVVVKPLICSNLPLQPRCQDRSYFKSPNGVLSAPASVVDAQPSERTETAENGAKVGQIVVFSIAERSIFKLTLELEGV